ncbi:MAG TPA: cytochrome c [Verrucomicrobium sp.]|nr:cytochrome c [Verrucomicrobium sp.]
MNPFSSLVLLLALSCPLLAGSPLPKEEDWPLETDTYKTGRGVELAQALCITCHSVEYVSTQPPLPRKFWEGVVKKMKDKYGAPLPDETTALVDYLTSVYGKSN